MRGAETHVFRVFSDSLRDTLLEALEILMDISLIFYQHFGLCQVPGAMVGCAVTNGVSLRARG